MPIAFRGFLPTHIWTAISELCTFFRDVCASSLDTVRMTQWKGNIVETLSDEVLLGGPVHYRWMYPFERFIYRLKNMVGNKSQVAASIVSAYLQLEITFLGSDYLGPEYKTKEKRQKRNEIVSHHFHEEKISIYNHPGQCGKVIRKRRLTELEFYTATHYVLSNTPEFDMYFMTFNAELRQKYPTDNEAQLYDRTIRNLPRWIQKYIWELRGHCDILQWVHDISLGFDHKVECTNTYKINNYRFCTEGFNAGKRKTCCQLQLKVQGGGYFYGGIEEIINMRCRHSDHLKFVLFKCRWFDPTHVLSTPSTGIVEVNSNRVYQPYDPFILAQQAEQVYFIDFPGQPQRTSQGWRAVCRVKPTNTIDLSVADIPFQDDGGTSSDLPVVEQMNDVGDLADDMVEEYNSEDVSEDSNNSVPEDAIDNDTSESESE
ncbi:hypothetical protein QQ045_033426 [Rhodiola kirilowii]